MYFAISSVVELETDMLSIPKIINGKMVLIIYLYIWCRLYKILKECFKTENDL